MSESDTPSGDKPQTPQAEKPATAEPKPKSAPARTTRAKAAPTRAATARAAATKKVGTRGAASGRSKHPRKAQEVRGSSDSYQSGTRVWPD
jgi:hypothetical protein